MIITQRGDGRHSCRERDNGIAVCRKPTKSCRGCVYKGRLVSIDGRRVRELKAQGMRPTDIAKALKIGRASVYRVLAAPGE
jgi:DNA invertase Pin-like site-specific DNA recombinase